MKRFLNAMFFTGLLIVVAGVGIYAGYNAINAKEEKPAGMPFRNAVNNVFSSQTETKPQEEDVIAKATEGANDIAESAEKLSENAILKFEYYYKNNGQAVVKEQKIPYFLAGKTSSDIEELFDGWKIKEYSPEGAVLYKEIEQTAKQSYLVTVTDGYIAVYYDEGIDGSKLKEITDTPVSALPEEETVRLEAGISVQGEDSLMRLLEDLSS